MPMAERGGVGMSPTWECCLGGELKGGDQWEVSLEGGGMQQGRP